MVSDSGHQYPIQLVSGAGSISSCICDDIKESEISNLKEIEGASLNDL